MTTPRNSNFFVREQTKPSWSRILNWSLGLPVLCLEAARWAGLLYFDRPALMLPPLFLLFGLSLMAGIWEGYHSQKEEDIYGVLVQGMLLVFWVMICAELLLSA